MYHSSLENPLVVVYTESLSRISQVVRVQLEGITRQIMIHELENSDPCQEEKNIERKTRNYREGKERMSKAKSNTKSGGVDEQGKEESMVMEEQGTKNFKEGTYNLQQVNPYKKLEDIPALVTDNSDNADDRKEEQGREGADNISNIEEQDNVDPSINTGDLYVLDTNIQNSICSVLRKINIGRAKKKRRQGYRANPFDIGRCKLGKCNRKNGNNQPKPNPKTLVKKKDLEQEALEIVQMAEDMGLQLKTSKEDAIKKD